MQLAAGSPRGAAAVTEGMPPCQTDAQGQQGTQRGALPGDAAPQGEGPARAAVVRREGSARTTVELAALVAATGRQRRTLYDALDAEGVAFCVASYAPDAFGLSCRSAARGGIAVARCRAPLIREVEVFLYDLQLECAILHEGLDSHRKEIARAHGLDVPTVAYLLEQITVAQAIYACMEYKLAALRGPLVAGFGALHGHIGEMEGRLGSARTAPYPLPERRPLGLPAPQPPQPPQHPPPPPPALLPPLPPLLLWMLAPPPLAPPPLAPPPLAHVPHVPPPPNAPLPPPGWPPAAPGQPPQPPPPPPPPPAPPGVALPLKMLGAGAALAVGALLIPRCRALVLRVLSG